jgi:hypothetical protein
VRLSTGDATRSHFSDVGHADDAHLQGVLESTAKRARNGESNSERRLWHTTRLDRRSRENFLFLVFFSLCSFAHPSSGLATTSSFFGGCARNWLGHWPAPTTRLSLYLSSLLSLSHHCTQLEVSITNAL